MDNIPIPPSTPIESTKQLKRRRGWRKFGIVFGSIVVILAIAVSATGLYSIPVISSAFGMGHPKNLGIKSSPEALASIKSKIPMKISGASVDYASGGAQAFEGSIPVDTSTTSEEITSWLNRFQGSDPLFTETQVKKFDGGLEISTMLNKYVRAPIYVKVNVTQTGPSHIALDITKAKLGIFRVPEKYIPQIEDFFADRINEAMASIPGFRMDTYVITDGASSFKGTFPAVAHPTPQGFSGLLSL